MRKYATSIIVERVCRPAAVLHGRLIALAQSAPYYERALVATPFQSVTHPPHPEKNKIPRTRGSDPKNKSSRAG